MKCKPGDIAYITRQPYLGHFVTVLRWQPHGKHVLPDGFPGYVNGEGCWVCEKHVGTFSAPVLKGGEKSYRDTRYAAIEDRDLRPIRDPGDDAIDEIVQRVGSPRIEGVPLQ